MSRRTYKDSGVDVAAADALTHDYKKLASKTCQQGVLSGVGGFSGMIELPAGLQNPVITACTDGVGTKLRLLIDRNLHETAGMDAAAMCLNDLVTTGARPLFMLDYLATGVLDRQAAKEVVAGFAHYCQLAGCALLGGETAEMPGFYPVGDYDVAGFAVGVVEKEKIIDGKSCRPGDVVIGVAANGVHSNGFSLVRKLLTEEELQPRTQGWQQLLAPTALYVPFVRELLQQTTVAAMAHITGGGLIGNAARTVGRELDVVLNWGGWDYLGIFADIEKAGVEREEMLSTFNCGLGYIVIVPRDKMKKVIDCAGAQGLEAWEVGSLAPGSGKVVVNGL